MNTNAIPVTFSGCKSEKIAQIVCAFRNFAYFCCDLHNNQRAKLAKQRGLFFYPLYTWFRTPLSCVNAPTAGYSVGQRVGTEPFYLHIVKLS